MPFTFTVVNKFRIRRNILKRLTESTEIKNFNYLILYNYWVNNTVKNKRL